MKTFLVLLSLLISVTSYAQGGGDRVGSGDTVPLILSVLYPSSPMMQVPTIRTVEIYANGRVVETIIKNRGSENQEVKYRLVEELSERKLAQVLACSSELASQDFTYQIDEYCMDDSGTYYRAEMGEKNFAVRFCGKLQASSSHCAKAMVKLLDKLSYKK